MKNYLTKRLQYVKYGTFDSNILPITMVIPQGSILGPFFFDIYINDFPQVSDTFRFLMYADDSTLYCSINDYNSDSLNIELNNINVWLKTNIFLNVDKTKYLILTSQTEPQWNLDLTINNIPISRVIEFNFLGIKLEESLTWNNQIDMIACKIPKIIVIWPSRLDILPKKMSSDSIFK